MCGIAGGTGVHSGAREKVVTAQLETLLRRGPDSQGFLPGARGVVGQTRLSVIDVAGGDPPLTDESGQVRAALNGEVYNYRELMAGLRERGHTFRSACDTEVVAHLAEELAPVELCRALDGMFALALWDERTGTLVLGRDRFGKKPLYYWTGGGELVFGSEIKAVLADDRVPRRLDVSVLPGYLAHGYAPSPRTFYEGIVSLPPGCVLLFKPGGEPVVERYWDLPSPADVEQRTGPELAAELRVLLRDAVARRLVADVPLGAFLSGGVDSSAVVGLMAELSDQPVRTFSIGFEEERFDERSWARQVAERFGTVHTEHVAQPDAVALLDEVLEACDQPFGDSSALPTFLLSQMTRRDVTVALSGDGGDEVFAGYERFAAGLAIGRAGRLPGPARGALHVAAARLPVREKVRRALEAAGAGLPDGYTRLSMVFSPEQIDRLLPAGGTTALRLYDDVWAASDGGPVLHRLLDLNIRTYLLDDLLVKVDRMSMRHGLEVRSPLLDPQLLSFAMSVAPGEHVRGRDLKRLLKASVADLLPAEILDRPKKGFGVPVDAWFRGPLQGMVRGAFVQQTPRLARLLDVQEVRRLVAEHDAGRDHGQRLWLLLMLEHFLQREGW